MRNCTKESGTCRVEASQCRLPDMVTESKSYQVMKWIPSKNKFSPVRDRIPDLSRAREWAAEERLRDRDSQFAVFDQNGEMIENEAGKLVA